MASGNFTISLSKEDLDRVEKTLYGLTELEKSATIDKGLKDATVVIMNEGRRNLKQYLSKKPVNVAKRTGRLERSFTNKVKRKKLAGYTGFKRPEGAPAHLVDSGTAERWTRKGAYRGKVIATKFWRRAVDTKAVEAIETLFDSIEKTINKIVNSGGVVS